MDKIYIRRGEKIIGPTTRDNLIKLRENQKLTDADQVSTDQKNWVRLADFLNTDMEEAEVAEEAELAQEDEDQGEVEAKESAVNIASQRQEKAMWRVTWLLGMGGTGAMVLALVLGFVFGFIKR